MTTSADTTKGAQWARWNWAHKGLGRWHRLFTDGDLTKTACQSPRRDGMHIAATTATTPENGPMCPTCKWVNDLHTKLVKTTDAISDTKVPVTVGGGERPADIPVPVGVCVCGAAGCNTPDVIALREKITVRRAEQRAYDEAQVAAILAGRQMAEMAA